MPEKVPFIDREDELALIDTLMREWGTLRILCVHAPGGIGKTRLLQEVRQRYMGTEQTRLIITDITDFDNRKFHVIQNIERRIAEMLDETIFEPYLRGLLDLRKMEIAKVSVERLNKTRLETNLAFIECFNRVSEKQRILLFFDTIDALERTDTLEDYLSKTVSQLKNTLILIAGRNEENEKDDDFGIRLQSELDEKSVQIINLAPLQPQAGEQYLQEKQKLLHIDLESELAQKLLFLSGGSPILIDLAIEWLARDIPFNWLVETRLEDLQDFSDNKTRRQEFERQLVLHMAQLRSQMDELMLLMSHVYPLDAEMATELLNIPKNEAENLFDEVETYVFVKQLPDRRISLHDEMRRMVNDYVWPELDPDGDRRRRDSKLAVEYLRNKIQALSIRIDQLQAEKDTAHNEGDVQAELNIFMVTESLERELWVLKKQLLDHTLFTNIEEGVTTFARIFDEATQAYRFSYRSTLFERIKKPYLDLDQLSPEQIYEIESRRVKDCLTSGKYSKARDAATRILRKEGVFPERQVDMLIERGNANIRMGRLEKGIDDFEEAVKISRKQHLQHWLARALNARGWAYRSQQNFEHAYSDYLEAYQLGLELHDQEQIASILNNMGYIAAIRGNQQKAIENCEKALMLWQEINSTRGIASTYSTLGFIYRLFGPLSDALDYYNKALDISTSQNDIEWMSNVRCGRAYVFLLQNQLDEAEEDLNWALDNGPRSLKPRVLYYLGRLFLRKNDLKKARQQYRKCRNISQKIGDRQFNYSCFDRLTELAWEFKEYYRWKEFYDEHNELFAGIIEKINLGVSGSALRHIGDLAICQGDYEPALEAYKEGLALIIEHETYKPSGHTIKEQIDQTDRRLRQAIEVNVLEVNVLRNLGKNLGQFWQDDKELMEKYPEILLTFQQWEQEGDNL